MTQYKSIIPPTCFAGSWIKCFQHSSEHAVVDLTSRRSSDASRCLWVFSILIPRQFLFLWCGATYCPADGPDGLCCCRSGSTWLVGLFWGRWFASHDCRDPSSPGRTTGRSEISVVANLCSWWASPEQTLPNLRVLFAKSWFITLCLHWFVHGLGPATAS